MADQQLQQAVQVLRGGGVVAYPTEGCYGLGCDPHNLHAVRRILRLKRRSRRQGVILIGARWHHLAPWVDPSDPEPIVRARQTWPGPHTWLLPARTGVSRWIRGDYDTVAVRLTAHPLAAALCRRFRGAVVSTSANRHGRPPARSVAQARSLFGRDVDIVLQGHLGRSKGPTDIRDAHTGEVIRA